MENVKEKEVGATLVAQYNLIETLREENQRLRAAVAEMEKMLPVLEWLEGSIALDHAMEGEAASVDNYRQTLNIALAKRKQP